MINHFPQICLIYDRYKKASSKKKATIEIRITYNYKQKYLSTGIRVYPNQWRKDKVINTPDASKYNDLIESLLSKIRQVLLTMSEEGNITLSDIPRRMELLKEKNISFLAFCKTRAEIRKYGKSKDSQERYNRFLRFFEEWGKIIYFEDVNEINIIAYDRYLESKEMKIYSKWNNYHRFLNSFILDALKDGLLNKNPYNWVNINKGKNIHTSRYLTEEEFYKIKTSILPTKCLERVRDLFIFQTYTCLSYSDLVRFKYNDVTELEGTKVYIGKRKKTDKPFTIPLVQDALRILDKYNQTLPIISNVKYNEYLKVVAQASGVDKPISSHWARHTGATMLLNEGIDMKIIARICGHSSTRITEQIYAKLLDETVVKAIKNSPTFTSKGEKMTHETS